MKEKAFGANATKEKKNPMSELTEQAVKNCEQAMRSGLKMQQEVGQWWNHWLEQGAPVEDFQKRCNNLGSLAGEFLPATQKRMEEMLELMEKNTRVGTALMKKAADAAQTPVIADSQAKWMEFWTSSLEAARANAEAMGQIGSRAIDSWIDFVQKNTEVTQIRVPKAA